MMLAQQEIDKEALEKALSEISHLVESDEPITKNDFSNEDLSILYSLAYSLYDMGDYSQAKLIFQQLVLSKPFHQKHWLGLGATLQMERQYTESLTAWSMSALLDDGDPTPHFHAAECLFSLDQQEEALKALHSAKERLAISNQHQGLKEKIEVMEETWLNKRQENYEPTCN